MIWLPIGFAVALAGAFLTAKVLPSALSGRSPAGILLIAAKLLAHAAVLLIAGLISWTSLLWAAGGELLALIGFAIYIVIKGRK